MNKFSDLLWTRNGLVYFKYPRLAIHNELKNCVFSRNGGVSAPPFDSLNSSYSVGDDPKNVTENLNNIKREIGARKLIFMDQVHGTNIAEIWNDKFGDLEEISETDALISRTPGIALMVKQADCQGVILFDTKNSAFGVVHCGWRGNVQNILGRVVNLMAREFGSKGSDIIGAIGPSLGPCCGEFVDHKRIFPGDFEDFMIGENHFDLWSLSAHQLMEAGVKESNIEIAGICTQCCTDLFYSYRGEGNTGRFATVAMLRKGM
ncbi:peptidoglycan editing factor PgeF [Thermodesulfobacteriota bacterium]